jgi:hypothetical protein
MRARARGWWLAGILALSAVGCGGSALRETATSSSSGGAGFDASNSDGGSSARDGLGDAPAIDLGTTDAAFEEERPPHDGSSDGVVFDAEASSPDDSVAVDSLDPCPPLQHPYDLDYFRSGCVTFTSPCWTGSVCCFPTCRADCYFSPWQSQPPDPHQCSFSPECVDPALCRPGGEAPWLGLDAAPH